MGNQHQIGEGVRVAGAMRGAGDLVIAGEVEGTLTLDGEVTCTATSTCTLEAQVTAIRIEGRFTGSVMASRRIDLGATAIVAGDLSAPTVTIAEGAAFRGRLEMPDATQTEPRRAPAATAPVSEPEPAAAPESAAEPAAAEASAPKAKTTRSRSTTRARKK